MTFVMKCFLFLVWLRIHCMEVFHYLADVLKNVPIFESNTMQPEQRTGAIYNDFDKENPFEGLSGEENWTMTLTQDATSDVEVISQEEVDKTILRQQLKYESQLFDEKSASATDSYVSKVKKILDTGNLYDAISEDHVGVYRERYRQKWLEPDSFYDAWLILNKKSREFFPEHKFKSYSKRPIIEESSTPNKKVKLLTKESEVEKDEGHVQTPTLSQPICSLQSVRMLYI